MMIEFIGVRALGDYKLEIEFSDATIGARDFSFICEKSGTMAEPLKDPAYFARVFIEEGRSLGQTDTIGIQLHCMMGWRRRACYVAPMQRNRRRNMPAEVGRRAQ